nr:telomere length regulation protein TEL2 homolog isoform X2 [Coffea arabica]
MGEVEEKAVLEKVGNVVASINGSKHVDQVISAVYSLAALLFPLETLSFIGSISEKYRDEVRSAEALSENQRKEWWKVFYKGAAFPALARVLLYDVASDWLVCFPISARKNVYDVFFVKGRMTEVVQAMVPCLQNRGSTRLLVLCLVENDGAFQMVKEFNFQCESEELTGDKLKQAISMLAQLVTSIPDKARPGISSALSSHLFFKSITTQLLSGAEEWDKNLPDGVDSCNKIYTHDTIVFIGEIVARICRRGSADVLLSELIPRVLCQARNFLSGTANVSVNKTFELKPGLRFWSRVIEEIKDSYAVERLSEQLLHQLAAQNTNDIEAYWILWILFHRSYENQPLIRSMFVDKFLLWKVFPICCLRWILHFAILECSPDNTLLTKAYHAHRLVETMQRLVSVWSKREFVQSSRLEQQAYVTAALGLCLEKMSKEDLDATKDAIHSILQGVSCRLESPDHLVRKMASSVALVFSKVVDPQNPLYLDDNCHDETIDWEFKPTMSDRSSVAKSHHKDEEADKVKGLDMAKEANGVDDADMGKKVKGRKQKLLEFKLVDPDEVIDPAALNGELISDGEGDDFGSEDSDSLSDTSLEPYDLTDDDADLKRKFSQLVDVVGALRKSDDVDGVEGALNVAEKLVRASPDELKYVASDLARTLVQVRCSDFTAEGEEESAEEKRQKALVALIVTCPLESLEALHTLLYSATVDVSQRIMILDVMTGAAQELASMKFLKPEYQPRNLISSVSDKPWFIPRNIGPPGASSWKEISTPGTPLNWSYSYERELPPRPGQIQRGKTRRWSLQSSVNENQLEQSQNQFPQYAAAFMLPAMLGFDKKRHGVDLLGRDFIVLGKLIFMLGVCIKSAAMHPEASVLASPLLDMLRVREISHHIEPYVRRSVLFAASCILVAIHPTHVASALMAGNTEIPRGLEWIRTWAHDIAESDTDRECYMLAMTCLQLHSEMALQTSRALESTEGTFGTETLGLPSALASGMIKIPRV